MMDYDQDFRRAREEAKKERGGNGHAKDALPSFVTLDKLNLSREVFWSIEDHLPRVTQIMVFGPGGCGKTYLGTSIAIGITAGQWFGHVAEQGAALICAFERPDDAEDRLAALRDKLQLGDLPLALLKLPGFSLGDTLAEHIIGQAKALTAATGKPVRAIIIDTVSAALAGAKEDDEGLGRLRAIGERIAADTGGTVFWLHHEGKADHNGPRGHLVLAEACGVWWRVEVREDGSRVVHVDKANRGPSYMPLFAFRLVPFVAGQDQRQKDIQLCELQLVDLDGAMASPPRQRFGFAPKTAPAAGNGFLQKMLLGELKRLARKHPDGVDEHLLKSAFILKLHADREAKGKAKLDAKDLSQKFRRTLAPLLKDGGPIECVADEVYLPADDE